MSKSTHTSTRNRRGTAKPAAQHPWIVDGIDCGPALAAVGDLAEWAFDLAAKDVADWPAGIRRVANARRYVMSRLTGKRPRSAPIDDLLWTAGLLTRIFESQLAFGMTEMISILDQLGLPTEVVPMTPRVQPNHRPPGHPNVIALRPSAGSPLRDGAPYRACCCRGYRKAA